MEKKEMTNNFMTNFERTKCITTRALQLSLGKGTPHPSIDLKRLNYDCLRIAIFEIDNKLIDLVIARTTNGETEKFKLRDINSPPSNTNFA